MIRWLYAIGFINYEDMQKLRGLQPEGKRLEAAEAADRAEQAHLDGIAAGKIAEEIEMQSSRRGLTQEEVDAIEAAITAGMDDLQESQGHDVGIGDKGKIGAGIDDALQNGRLVCTVEYRAPCGKETLLLEMALD